jgi:hypothetical protein
MWTKKVTQSSAARLIPPFLGCRLSYLRPPLWRHALSPRRAALFAECFCGRVFAVVRNNIFDLTGQYAHDMDGVADHIGGAAFAFRASRHNSPRK